MSTDSAPFRRLKPICVPLLAASNLTNASIPHILTLLTELHEALQQLVSSGEQLSPSLAGYVFFPLSTLLRRNEPAAIPDQVLEKTLISLSILIDVLWWDCDLAMWEQLLMLCGAVVSGIESPTRRRDEETLAAAAQCLLALLRERTPDDARRRSCTPSDAAIRLFTLQQHAQSPKLVPILGQTLSALLDTAHSRQSRLQSTSLQVLSTIIKFYTPDNLMPSVLPGIISSMVKLALGTSSSTGSVAGETVAGALRVMADAIVKAIGDEICIKDGAIRPIHDLEDLATLGELASQSEGGESQPYTTLRTPSWLRGTSSQLLIALNSLTPLVSHGNPSALLALVRFSMSILQSASQSLPQSLPLLLSFLLSLSGHDFPTVADLAHESLVALLTSHGKGQHRFLQVIMQVTRENLSSLPRLITSQSDSKVEHVAKLIEAVCHISSMDSSTSQHNPLPHMSSSIGKLLGPSGGVEKWGWTLLSVLDFSKPTVVEYTTTAVRLLLEADYTDGVAFTFVPLKHVASRSTYDSLERMFHALGHAAGDECVYAIEWFANIGYDSKNSRSVAALWCACRFMEGLAGLSLLTGTRPDPLERKPSRRLEKLCRMLAKRFSHLWDIHSDIEGEGTSSSDGPPIDEDTSIEFVQGMVPLHRTLRLVRETTATQQTPLAQPSLHRAFSLQLIALSAGTLQAQFAPLLLYALYPVLHSLISAESLVSSTAMATLDYLTTSLSYASPSNLLLSNFDYALDGVSRRLTKRWLDIDATKVLVLLVRLVGSDVVDKAGDIVEECFTRLDEYHGYDVLVDGLVEVLGEVIQAIDTGANSQPNPISRKLDRGPKQTLDELFEWIAHRGDPIYEQDETDYGPAPQQAWGEENTTQDTGPSHQHDDDTEEPPNPAQTLTKQIVAHSLYFLTHGSPVIRARILDLLTAAVPILPQAALLSSIHQAWPFILNRLSDPHTFVVGAAAALIESLSVRVGPFMFQRIWNDVWPRFLKMLRDLDRAEGTNALTRRGFGAVGTESAYTHSHRLYRSMLKTMTATMEGVDPQDSSIWQVIMEFRRFLHKEAHEELQTCARALYIGVGRNNADAVWLALHSTSVTIDPSMKFMHQTRWDISENVEFIFGHHSIV